MAKYELRLPDGTAVTAIGSLSIKWLCNEAYDLALGSACAAMLEATVYGDVRPEAGMELVCLEDGVELGRFTCEMPLRAGKDKLTLTAYDRMTRFDRDITAWLEAQRFPCTAMELFGALCDHCGVTPREGTVLPEMTLQAFTQPALTGRQLLKYLGQGAGVFFRIDPAGLLEAKWYAQELTPLGDYLLGSFVCGDYSAAPIERVVIRSGEGDTGGVWPDGSDQEANTYIIQGNPLLNPAMDRQAAARRLYERLKDYRCTPFSCTLLPGSRIQPGERVSFVDHGGNLHTAPVMELTLKNGRREIRATASAALQSTSAFNRLTLEGLQGRVLTVERTAQGLKAENTDLKGNAAALTLTLEGITSRVTAAEDGIRDCAAQTAVSALEQKADSLSIRLTQLSQQAEGKADRTELEEVTEHFLFGTDGLTITNTATGMGIGVSEEQISFTGGKDPTTVITPNAMETTNLYIANRLDLGDFSFIPRGNRNLSLRYTAR